MNGRVFSPGINNRLKHWYNIHALHLMAYNKKVHLMNLGFFDENFRPDVKAGHDDFNWDASENMLNLYLKTLEKADNSPGSALEVGSGLGGGCFILKKYFNIRSVTGIDQSHGNIIFSKRKFKHTGIRFRKLKAEHLASIQRQFDLVLSVEASQHFTSLHRFFHDVGQILTERGLFLYADIFSQTEVGQIKKMISNSSLKTLEVSDITKGVASSIGQLPPAARKNILQRFESWWLNSKSFEPYAGSELHQNLLSGRFAYLIFKITKDLP